MPKKGMGQIEQPKRIDTEQTEQNENCVWTKLNTPKFVYAPKRTDQNGLWTRPNRRKSFEPNECQDPNSVQTMIEGRTWTPVRDPKPSSPYLSWVAELILGTYFYMQSLIQYDMLHLVEQFFFNPKTHTYNINPGLLF